MSDMAAWRNGIASDYDYGVDKSGDCRFDPCGGQSIFFAFRVTYNCNSINILQRWLQDK